MEIGVQEKVIIITGASRGIGADMAKTLGKHGATVIVNYHSSEAKAEEVLSHIKENGGDGMTFKADVRDSVAINSMIDSTIEKFGKVDVLINNANINFAVKPFMAMSWEEMNEKIMGETQALYNCSQAVLKDMLKRKSGKLILISSTLSREVSPGFVAHSAAKSVVDNMAKSMAAELGPEGITVNVIAPGLVKTDATADQPIEVHEMIASFTPLRRVAEPNDISGLAVFLSSSLSDYVTGQYIPVDGGSFMI